MSTYASSQNVVGASSNFNQPTSVQTNGAYVANDYYSNQTQPTNDGGHLHPPRVDDALSYLDQVRQQFTNNPEVYNDFLEVMKEFKSHTIDTPGVIQRVSQLFSGHYNLITGFNTFLPPGYQIRITGSMIRIIQPSGETSSFNQSSNASINANQGQLYNAEVQPMMQQQQTLPQARVQTVGTTAAHLRSDLLHGNSTSPMVAAAPFSSDPQNQTVQTRQIHSQQPPAMQVHQQAASQYANSLTYSQQTLRTIGSPPTSITSTETFNESKMGGHVVVDSATGQPLHFDQAVGYLNKVKERFADRPAIYREFLNILGNYQKISNEQGSEPSMSETEVYQAVAQLFVDEEDLMRDFKSYLPDAGLENGDNTLRVPKEEPSSSSSKSMDDASVNGEKASSTTKTDGGSRHTKKRQLGAPISPASAVKKSKVVTKVLYDANMEKYLEDIPLKDFVFFERVHKALKNESVVKNFFRCLLLYNKNLLSKQDLLEVVTPFLSEHPDLMRQFSEILKVGARAASPNKLQKVENRLHSDLALQIDYSTCKRLGVSYRSLPESYGRSTCSGRTKLCNSVLNDTWVSFPSWSSESTESVSSKKSVFEDFMYRTEDERFEVDILIEVNTAGITALEAVRKQMEDMRPEEVQNFKLDEKYGCDSPTLMGRAIKKLYGEHATKVLEGLRDNPVIAVPQVLKRLREKDAEWRSVREEFNVIWRDQIEKNYLKSLDHQAISFKTNDLKFLRSKAIITQLESYYDERQSQIENGEYVERRPHMVLDYPEDVSVIHDANELLIHHVKRQQNIPKKEKFMIKKLLRLNLIPRLFNLETECMSNDEEENENCDKTQDGQITTRRARRLLEAKLTSKKAEITTTDSGAKNNTGYALFFGTNCWLIFIRLHHIMCDRLARLKRKTNELIAEYRFEMAIRERQQKIYERHGNTPMSHQHNAVDVQLGLRELKKPLQNPEHFYSTLLHELKNLLDGITDSVTFEDVLRNMFGTNAYIMFTMDKLVSTITRQIQNFVADEASISAINLFQKYITHRARNTQPFFALDEQYESAAEKIIVNQNCYKTYFIHMDKPVVSIELINTDTDDEDEEEECDESIVQLSKWCEFVEKYATSEETETNLLLTQELFLLRNILPRKSVADASFDPFSPLPPTVSSSFYVNDGLRAVLSAKNLRLLYEHGTSDMLIKYGAPYGAKKTHRDMFERRRVRFTNWLNSRRQAMRREVEKVESPPDFKWFADNCRCCLYRHRDFEYITYTRYFTLSHHQSQAGSISSQSQSQPPLLPIVTTVALSSTKAEQTNAPLQSTSTTTVGSSLSMSPSNYVEE